MFSKTASSLPRNAPSSLDLQCPLVCSNTLIASWTARLKALDFCNACGAAAAGTSWDTVKKGRSRYRVRTTRTGWREWRREMREP